MSRVFFKQKALVISLSAVLGMSAPAMAAVDAPIPDLQGYSLAKGELLPTGQRITPKAAPGALFQRLDPGLSRDDTKYQDFTVGQAVTTSVSPDGGTLLILTSGYNRYNDAKGQRVAAESNEYVFVYDITGEIPLKKQVIQLPNTFNGIAWNPNGQEFYVSGGRDDNVYVYAKPDTNWVEQAKISLAHGPEGGVNKMVPIAAGLATTADGKRLLVANMQNDSVSLIDLEKRTVLGEVDLRPGKVNPTDQGKPGGEYPFWVAVQGNSKAYVSSQRDREVVILGLRDNKLAVDGRIPVGGQPNKMILNREQTRLFVANGNSDSVSVIDTLSDKVVEEFNITVPEAVFPEGHKLRGANPNSLALSPDEHYLLVTNGGTNSVAVVRLAQAGRDVEHEEDDDEKEEQEGGYKSQVIGLIPTGWYPNSVSLNQEGNRLYIVNGKSNAGPNPGACRDTTSIASGSLNDCNANNQYVWQLTKAGFLTMPIPKGKDLARLTWQVAYNNNFLSLQDQAKWASTMAFLRSKIKHVIYVVKENRTYDQVLGDLKKGNGDPDLAILAPYSPNHQKLASGFVNLDNFYDSGEVSGDGWNWTTAARSTDYTEKTVPVNYAGRGFTYDWEGNNRNINVSLPDRPNNDLDLLPGTADVAAPDTEFEAGAGYLWDGALRAGLTIRNYGFFVNNIGDSRKLDGKDDDKKLTDDQLKYPYANAVKQAKAAKQALADHTDEYFRGYDQNNADYYLFKEWEREFVDYVKKGNLPNLSFVRFPHDHFGNYTTARFGVDTVEEQMADNDYAVGLLVEKVAKSPYKNDTLIFIIEDDAQNGADHVDSHRSIAYIVGPYVKQGALISKHYTTVSMVRTIEDVLGIEPMGITDGLAVPMADVFDTKQKKWDYKAIVPQVLYETELPLPKDSTVTVASVQSASCAAKPKRDAAYWAAAMVGLDFSVEDKLDEPRFNRALWAGLKGEKVAYPEVRHGRDLRNGRTALLKAHFEQLNRECKAKIIVSSK